MKKYQHVARFTPGLAETVQQKQVVDSMSPRGVGGVQLHGFG